MTRTANGHGEDDDAAAAIQAIDDMGEVELGTVRLINGSDAGPRSWDPKRGEHRQHISTVLGEAFYSSQRQVIVKTGVLYLYTGMSIAAIFHPC